MAFALALVLGLATLFIGFYADDWALIATLEGKAPRSASPLDVYRFGTGEPEHNREFILRGPWPWWTLPELKLHFFRPLASGLLALDHALFGHAPLGYHLHAIGWWLLFVWAAWLLLRRSLPAAVATLALLAFVIDDAHVQPIGWISCRHMLVGATPALLGLCAHLRWRENGFRPGRVLGLLGLGVGLLGSEAALGVLGYYVAYESWGRRDALRTRIAALAPPMVLGLAFVVGYKALGYGASGSGSYVEPLEDPLGFLSACLVRIPILLGDLLLSVPSDFSNVAPDAPMIVIGAVGVALVAWLARVVWPSLSEVERSALRWLAPGAVLATFVGLPGFPGSRVLLLPSVGAFGALALLVERAIGLRAARAAAWSFVLAHGLGGPLLAATWVITVSKMARGTERIEAELRFDPPLPKRVYVLVSSDPMAAFTVSATRLVRRERDFSSWSILSMAAVTHRVTKTGPRTLVVETTNGTLFDGSFVEVFRARRHSMHAGDAVALDGATVTVLRDTEGAPTAIELALDVPLDDPSVALLAWQDGALRHVALTDEPLEIPWSAGPASLF